MPDKRRVYRDFEGGVALTAEQGGKFLAVIDEGTLADLLPEELERADLVKTIEFETEEERSAYLLKRFGPRSQTNL